MKSEIFLNRAIKQDVYTDHISCLRILLNNLALDEALLYFVPYLFAVHHFGEEGQEDCHDEHGNFIYPPLCNLSYGSMDPDGIYLMDDGQSLKLFVSKAASREQISQLFGHDQIFDMEAPPTEDMIQF